MQIPMFCRALTGAVGLFVLSSDAIAATTNVPFAATVISACVLTVGTPGVMATSADYTVLDSEETGGVSGLVTIVSTGAAFAVSADAPTDFTVAPSGGGDNVTFEASYQATGATSIGETLGSVTTPLNLGLTSLTVDLKGTKSTGVFPQGVYAAEVVVRCE